MQQVNTLDIAAGKVVSAGRGIQVFIEGSRRGVLTLNQGRQRLFSAIETLLRQITSDTQPNSAYYLGTYVPFLDSTQRPVQGND